MRIIQYVPVEHYPHIYRWWKLQTGRVLDPAQISDCGGVVYSDKDLPIAASWLYYGNSQLAHIGFTVADPSCGPKERINAVTMLIDFLTDRAEDLGMRYVVSNSDRSALTKLFKKAGYVEMDQHTSLSRMIEYPLYAEQGLL